MRYMSKQFLQAAGFDHGSFLLARLGFDTRKIKEKKW